MRATWKEKFSSKKNRLKAHMEQGITTLSQHSPLIKSRNIDQKEQEQEKEDTTPPDILTKTRQVNTTARFELGKDGCNRILLENNYHVDFDRLSLSAEQGNMEAQFQLGDLYALGQGTSKNVSHAYKWYTKAAVQGYKKALIRIHNLYQEDVKMHCRGQINSDEEQWTSKWFMRDNNIRELNEYRLAQNQAILNGAIDYYTEQFKHYRSCNQDDSVIQLNLAFFYQHGYGVKKCTRWAFEYYRLAAEQGNIDAQYNLGNLYQKHEHMKFNYRDAFKWFTKSAQGGHIAAQKSLAYFYLKGLATDMDHGTATFWYTKAAAAGDSGAQVILGKLYRKGECVKQDISIAVEWYSLAARQGNIVAQNCLSQLHQRGLLGDIELGEDMSKYFTEDYLNSRLCTKLSADVSKLGDLPNFKQLYELARRALIGDGQAMHEIGLKYLKGDTSFSQDQETGIKWIKNAANAKHRDAQLMIADLYKKGKSVKQDYYKAAIWYKRLSKKKDSDAQCNVGIMYNEGLGVREDPLEASKWFIWATDQGNSDGQYNLGRLRLHGRGLGKDIKEGIAYILKSAYQRNIQACYHLGELYVRGAHKLNEDPKTGLRLMNFATQSNCTEDLLILNSEYSYWRDINKEARNEYLKIRSDAGNAESKYDLATIYLNGDDVDQDYVKSYNLFKEAMDQGNKSARWIFDNSLGFPRGINRRSDVVRMFTEVTEKGIGDFHYHIGSIYELGIAGGNKVDDINYIKAKEWYIAASKIGDSRADYRLGIMHEYGKGVRKHMNTAIDYYDNASSKGNSDASYRLACMYLDGSGVARDLLKAFQYYETASAMGHQGAINALTLSEGDNSIVLYHDSLAAKDIRIQIKKETKVRMLEKATDKGWARLQYKIGVMYYNDDDSFNAFKWLSLAADFGVTDAYYKLGVLKEEGYGVEQDYTVAANLYYKAAEKEHEDACYRLGRLYLYGNGVERDDLKAYWFYKMASDMGHTEAYKVLNITLETKVNSNGVTEESFLSPSSPEYHYSLLMCEAVAEYGDPCLQFKVGYAYEHSILEPNYVDAYSWYYMAAASSHKEAMYCLGLLHEKGLGVSQDYQIANQLYLNASQLGSDDALYQLGTTYHYGKGAEIDFKKAMGYYTRSAELGKPAYQCELGRLYEEGEIVQKDLLEALKWYTKAYLQGYDYASSNLYPMYDDKPYEDFFFKKLFLVLSKISCACFRLKEHYRYDDFCDINYRLGIFCALGYGTKRNAMKSWEYFTKEYSDVNFPFTFKTLLLLEYDLSFQERTGILKTFEEDEELMDQTDAHYLYELGKLLFDGIVQDQYDYTVGGENRYSPKQGSVIAKDYSTALKYLKRAADKNHPSALLQLGFMYYCGYGFDQEIKQGEICFGSQNFKLAFEWYKRSERWCVDETYDGIYFGLALLYEYGDGAEQDYQRAFSYYKKLADAEDLAGLHRLALMYYYGKGVSVDYKESFKLFKQSTTAIWKSDELPFVYFSDDSSRNNSQSNLVYCVMNYTKIRGESYYYMGLQIKNGKGVNQNKFLADMYFKRACEKGCTRAKYGVKY